MAEKSQPDTLYLIRARIDSGRSRGSPQLNKDIRVLKKAAAEIEQLRTRLAEAERQRDALLSGVAACYEMLLGELNAHAAADKSEYMLRNIIATAQDKSLDGLAQTSEALGGY